MSARPALYGEHAEQLMPLGRQPHGPARAALRSFSPGARPDVTDSSTCIAWSTVAIRPQRAPLGARALSLRRAGLSKKIADVAGVMIPAFGERGGMPASLLFLS